MSQRLGRRASQQPMFGSVASEATVWRTFDQIGSVELRGIASARAAARERAWSAGAGPAGDDLIIDFDATLINTKADKQDARPNYKRGYGHHPLLAIVAETDEVLTAKLRPGNAGSNTAVDHVTVLADALANSRHHGAPATRWATTRARSPTGC